MKPLVHHTRSLARSASAPRGETPILVMLGLVVFAILALSAGPALLSLSSQSATVSADRRVDKALAVLTDTQRRAPWQSLPVGGPYVETVTLAGNDVDVATWVQLDPDSPSRKVITKAVRGHLSDADCLTAPTPDVLPEDGCVVRTAVVASTATDISPPMSPLVQSTATGATGSALVPVSAGTTVFTLAVTEPLLISTVLRSDQEQMTLQVLSYGIERAKIDVQMSDPGGQWRFGNAVACPTSNWSGDVTVQLETPSSVTVGDLLVLTTPAPDVC